MFACCLGGQEPQPAPKPAPSAQQARQTPAGSQSQPQAPQQQAQSSGMPASTPNPLADAPGLMGSSGTKQTAGSTSGGSRDNNALVSMSANAGAAVPPWMVSPGGKGSLDHSVGSEGIANVNDILRLNLGEVGYTRDFPSYYHRHCACIAWPRCPA